MELVRGEALSTVDELTEGAVRLRAEVRRLTDVHQRLSQAKVHRTWAGPASDRFATTVDRRLREIGEQRDVLDILARRLDDAATEEAAKHPAHANHPKHPVSGGVAISGGGAA